MKKAHGKGVGVFTGEMAFSHGEVVCDYHGEQLPAKEGERRLKLYADDQSGRNLYMFYVNGKGKRSCIDGKTVPCPCHRHLDSNKGRLIYHSSSSSPNLIATRMVLDGKEHVFLVVKAFIPPFTELKLDYFVRVAEN